jgi:hypothetical protein
MAGTALNADVNCAYWLAQERFVEEASRFLDHLVVVFGGDRLDLHAS